MKQIKINANLTSLLILNSDCEYFNIRYTMVMKKFILVCDDDPGIVDVATIILEENGYDVATASRGDEVLAAVEARKPDLILLDLWMPGMTGEKITKQLKSQPTTEAIPIIIFSANKDTHKIATEAGADAFISKPFDINELEQKIQSILE